VRINLQDDQGVYIARGLVILHARTVDFSGSVADLSTNPLFDVPGVYGLYDVQDVQTVLNETTITVIPRPLHPVVGTTFLSFDSKYVCVRIGEE
jgi:hypothetical protein